MNVVSISNYLKICLSLVFVYRVSPQPRFNFSENGKKELLLKKTGMKRLRYQKNIKDSSEYPEGTGSMNIEANQARLPAGRPVVG